MNKPDIVKLEIRSYGGKDCLFTSDGKLLANQSHFKSGYICNQQLEAIAPLEEQYFLFRCDDGTIRKERVLLTKDWRKL